MAYADKCFYFDWGNRMIKLEDFDVYDKISVRSRWMPDDPEWKSSTNQISIELWGKDKEDGTRNEDAEIVLSRDNAMILATKLIRAVNELDTKDALADLHEDVDILRTIHSSKKDHSYRDAYNWRVEHNCFYSGSRKQGMGGALENYIDTPRGADALKEFVEDDKEEENGKTN